MNQSPRTSRTTVDEVRPSTTTNPGAAGSETVPSESGSSGIQMAGGSLPVHPNRTFERVQTVMGSNASPPETVILASSEEMAYSSQTPPFWAAMGAGPRDVNRTELQNAENGRLDELNDGVVLYTGKNDTALLQAILVHEYVHYVQYDTGRLDGLEDRLQGKTTDEMFASRAVAEGSAVYVSDAYARRYDDVAVSNSERIRRRVASEPAGSPVRWGNLVYLDGYRYVASRVHDPSETDRVFRNPPTTSEQVLHGYAPDEEPVRNLTVDASDPDDGWVTRGKDRRGEAFLRVALRNGLDERAARRAAAGWGNDDLRVYQRTGSLDNNYVWTIRFDDAANASEFTRLFREYLEGRGANRTNATWRVNDTQFTIHPVGDDTVTVLVGSEAFVTRTTVAGESGNVSVTLPSEKSPD